MALKGGVQANIKFSPQKSQIFIAVCSFSSSLCLLASFAFLWTERERWEVPLYCGGVLILLSFICWLISHKSADLSGAPATEIKISPDQMSVSMDPRADFNKNLLQGFSDYINVIINRKPLPMPSGVVNSDGTIIPGSSKEAEEEVNKLNLIAEEQYKQAVKLFGGERPSVKEPDPVSIEPPNFTGDILPGN